MKSNRKNRCPRPFNVETLESRLVLSGDVSALLFGNDLILHGDADDNQITITQPSAATLRIAGLDDTTINGRPSFDVQNFAGNLIVQMQEGGDDQLIVFGPLGLPHDLRARIAGGEIVVEGSEGVISIAGNLTLQTGEEGVATIRNEVRTAGQVSVEAGEVFVNGGRATLPNFAAAKFDNSLKINNPYFPVVPGAVWTYHSEGIDDETGEPTSQEIIVEVLADTRTILGVKVRVVRDRVYEDGLLIEDTFDWYAQDNNGNVWYLGEDVTNFEYDEDGKLIGTDHHGAWEAGQDGSRAGIIMEARPRIGHRYFQEFSPNNVMDWGEGLAKGQTATVPQGTFTNVFRTEESSVMEPLSSANKLYAPGVGTIAEFELDIEDNEVMETVRLVSLTLNGKPVSRLVPGKEFQGVNTSGRFIGGADTGGQATLSAGGPMVINGAKFRDELRAEAEEELIVIDSTLSDALLSTDDTLSLKGVFSDGTVQVGGNPDDVHIFDSRISRFVARFGKGNNTLSVTNSDFDVFIADGGAGKNIFNDAGNNDFGTLRLRRFVRS